MAPLRASPVPGALVFIATVLAASIAALPLAHAVPVKGGLTTITTSPGVADALLKVAILPFATGGGKQTLLTSLPAGPRVILSYPIVGGNVTAKPPSGVVKHTGGLVFININKKVSLELKNFVVDLNKLRLFGRVAGTKTVVAVFELDLKKTTIVVKGKTVFIRSVGLNLTRDAARALNTVLKTKVFRAKQRFGYARSEILL